MSEINKLNPRILWTYFDQILKIPRPSGHEENIRNFLIEFAKQQHLEYQTDPTGNLVIRKPATKGINTKKGMVLQSHMDMVGEKNSGSSHDFLKDPIQGYIDGTWIRARDTTLGADDGIGIAAQMAVLASDDLVHGPLECLFTIEEETGLKGAFGLQKDFIHYQTLLNLDSEDEGELFIGCAGGSDLSAWFEYDTEPTPLDHKSIQLQISGLIGGHSGDDIHKGRANSIIILTRFLYDYGDKLGIRVHKFEGGNLRNAIPREARAIITVPGEKVESLISHFAAFHQIIRNEYQRTDPGIEMHSRSVEPVKQVILRDVQKRLLMSLYACPHGVISWSQQMPDMVETSTNLASLTCKDHKILIGTSQRSSLDSAKSYISHKVENTFLLAGAKTKRSGFYPGWEPNPDSEIVKITAGAYQSLFSTQPVIRAIHAGLECGLFLETYPDLDMVSFGPTIKGAHSPDERLDIESTIKFWNLLVEVLKRSASY